MVCAGLLAGAPEAAAQTKVNVGTLTCSGDGGVGFVIGSKSSFACKFNPVGQAPQSYAATITKLGVDVGITGKTVLVWTVLAPSAKLKRKALAGNYGGAAANVAVGVGGGANLLVGGSNNSIALQPLSVQGQTGLNVAVGIAGLELR